MPGTPWLLRFFDQIRFFPVTAAGLLEMREAFPQGKYSLDIRSKTPRPQQPRRFPMDAKLCGRR